MAQFLFVLTRGMEDPTRATRCLQLAHAAKQDGHDVGVFLTDDAVLLAKKGMAANVVAPTGDDVNTFLESLTRANVTFHV
jgi:predicted peroxiredoxin